MADALKDNTLRKAQEEFHRRLLREEKLKRIQAEEMRRLAASGWKPPIERTATAGSSVHAAADAIEETERRRRAYAQEAQRRAEARRNDPLAMRDQFDVRRRAQDQKDLNKKLDETEDLLNQVEGNLRDYGRLTAGESAKALRRYLDKTGGVVRFTPEYLRQFDAVKKPEARIQQHFVDWMTNPKVRKETVYVDGLPRTLSVTSKWERIGDELLNLRDGETIERSSYWTAPFDWSTLPGMDELDLWGVAGGAQLRGDGNFRFTRRGDKIEFQGLVDHNYRDRYNFESGTEFRTLQLSPPTFQGEDARQLALHGRAKEFGLQSQWAQLATGTLQIAPDGRIELVEPPRWVDVEPQEWRPWR
jgi:hypothetical protein